MCAWRVCLCVCVCGRTYLYACIVSIPRSCRRLHMGSVRLLSIFSMNFSPFFSLFFSSFWGGQGTKTGKGDSDLWNTMIHPLLPMRFKYAVWLQSESDVCAKDDACIPQRGGEYYSCQIQAMIKDWRAKFKLALPFLWVQIRYTMQTCFHRNVHIPHHLSAVTHINPARMPLFSRGHVMHTFPYLNSYSYGVD